VIGSLSRVQTKSIYNYVQLLNMNNSKDQAPGSPPVTRRQSSGLDTFNTMLNTHSRSGRSSRFTVKVQDMELLGAPEKTSVELRNNSDQ